MLTGIFERCMKRRGVKESDPFDWEKATEIGQPSVVVTNNTTQVLSRPITCTSYGAEFNNQFATITSIVDNVQKELDNKKSTPEVFIILNKYIFKNCDNFKISFFSLY